jgi:hypothetical protein
VLRFDTIPQPWLRGQVKRFLRWRISTAKSYHQINRDSTALQRLADAFTAQAGPDAEPGQFTRATIEAYLSLLVERGLGPASRGYDLSSVRSFLRAVRRHDWTPELPHSADIFPGDRPRLPEAAPRSLPEFVMGLRTPGRLPGLDSTRWRRAAVPTLRRRAPVRAARPSVVHAKRHQAAWELDADVWTDAVQLNQQLCDLAMLYLLSYSGEYVDPVSTRYAADAHPRPLGSHLTS